MFCPLTDRQTDGQTNHSHKAADLHTLIIHLILNIINPHLNILFVDPTPFFLPKGLEFRISNGKEATDCIVEPISTDFELTSHNLKRFMLEHATLLLNFDPSFVNYWGKVRHDTHKKRI